MKKNVKLLIFCAIALAIAILVGVFTREGSFYKPMNQYFSPSKAKETSKMTIAESICTNADCLPEKQHSETRRFDTITLSNSLAVLMISDPTMNKSAAAMDVRVGSLEDPQKAQGLAHFLEHMLFLGTEKYPDIEEYNRYLSKFQGHSNAYTASKSTNYYFEVNHEGFEGSLDRFAQFFISPLFNEEFVERELNAVHSEHQKNLENDAWRVMQVHRGLYAAGHPARTFSTGDKSTLGTVTRDTLLEFHKKHYSANQMKLVLMSSLSIEQMKQLALEKFAAVPNFERNNLTYPKEIFKGEKLPRMISIKPIKDLKYLELVFQVPNPSAYWKSKPDHFLCHLIGHEGKGSLLSLLKKENLASGLSCGLSSVVNSSSELHVKVTLTEKGQSNYQAIVGHFFGYVKLMREVDLPEALFRERKTMANVDFTFKEPEEGGGIASLYASRMHYHEPLDIDRNDQLLFDFSPKDYKTFLAEILPEKLNLFIVHRKVSTDQKEKYYGTEYKVEGIDQNLVEQWKQVATNSQLTIPAENPFIPNELSFEPSSGETKPEKIMDDSYGTFWYQQDDQFKLPKSHVQLDILSNLSNSSPKSKALSLLYVRALNEQLNEWNYVASLAGLHFSIARTDRGLRLSFDGYSENIPQLMNDLAKKMTVIDIADDQFETIKKDLKRSIENSAYDVAYQQLLYEMKYYSRPNAIHRDALYTPKMNDKVDLISDITTEDIQAFANKLFQSIAIEGAAYGTVNKKDLKNAVKSYTLIPGQTSTALPETSRPLETTYRFEKGKPLAITLSSENNNNCWGESLQFGARDPKLNAVIRIGQAQLGTSFLPTLERSNSLATWSTVG